MQVAATSSKVKYYSPKFIFRLDVDGCNATFLWVGFLLMAYDEAVPTSIIGTFSLKDMGKAIDCKDDGSKVYTTNSVLRP